MVETEVGCVGEEVAREEAEEVEEVGYGAGVAVEALLVANGVAAVPVATARGEAMTGMLH